MQRTGEQPVELSVEEQNLLSVAYKDAVGSRRAAWRIMTGVEQKDKTGANKQQAYYAKEHAVQVEVELEKICDGILALMDKNLIPSASTGELKVFYYKMKGDHYRFLAEFATGDTKSKVTNEAADVPVMLQRQVPVIRSVRVEDFTVAVHWQNQ